MMNSAWMVAVLASGLPEAEHVMLLMRVDGAVDPAMVDRAQHAARKAMMDKLGTQNAGPPDPFPNAADHKKEGDRLMLVARAEIGTLGYPKAWEAVEHALVELELAAVNPQGVLALADAHALAMLVRLSKPRGPDDTDATVAAEAEENAKRALILNPKITLDRQLSAPEDVAFLTKVSKAMQLLGKGSLDVVSTPAGAQVFVDGQPAGVTPLKKKAMAAGPHLVQVISPWCDSFSATVPVAPGNAAHVEATLRDSQGMAGARTRLADDPLGDKAGEWSSPVRYTLKADHAVVIILQGGAKAQKGSPVDATAHLYNLNEGVRRRRVEASLRPKTLEAQVAALVTQVLDVAAGPGTPGGAHRAALPEGAASAHAEPLAPASTVAVVEGATSPARGGMNPMLPWLVMAGAVPVAAVLGSAAGFLVGAVLTGLFWQWQLNTQVAAAQRGRIRRQGAATAGGF